MHQIAKVLDHYANDDCPHTLFSGVLPSVASAGQLEACGNLPLHLKTVAICECSGLRSTGDEISNTTTPSKAAAITRSKE